MMDDVMHHGLLPRLVFGSFDGDEVIQSGGLRVMKRLDGRVRFTPLAARCI